MFVAPPIGRIEMFSALRFRLWRSASASSATWSLTPSTSTTARESAPMASACAAAATSGVPPSPSAGSTAGGWNRRLSFTCLAQEVYVARVHSLVLFARHPQLPRFRYNGDGRVHFPRCRLARRLAGEVGFGAPRDSRAALGSKGPVLYRILDTNFYEKALFVKTAVAAALCGMNTNCSALRAMLLFALSGSSLFGSSVYRMRSVFSSQMRCNLPSGLP
jgi:hypothetical protein